MSGAAGLSKVADESKVDAEGLLVPTYACNTPLKVIGVQKETPVCWNRDGTLLCFVLGNKAVCIHRVIEAGPRQGEFKVEAMLEGHGDIVRMLSFHPEDSNVLVSGGYEGIWVWNVAERRVVKKIEAETSRDAHTSDVLCCEWAFDGTSLLTGSKDSDVKVWDTTNDYKLLETIVGHKASVLSIVHSPTSNKIATAGRDSTIKVWDGSTLVPEMRAQRADDSGIKCALLNNLDGHRGDVVTLSWDASGFILFSGARDNTIKVWDARSGVPLRDLEDKANYMGKHRGDVRKMVSIATTPYMISCSLDSTLKVWQVAPTVSAPPLELSEAKRDEAEAKLLASILGDGQAIEEAKAVGASDKLIATIPVFIDEGVYDMALNPALPILATSSSTNAVKLWTVANFAAPTVLQEFRGHVETVNEACLVEDSTLVTVSNDYHIHMYDIETSARPRHVSFDASVLCAAVRSSGERAYVFAGGADYTIKAYAVDHADHDTVNAPGRDTKPENHEYVAVKFVGHAGRVKTLALHPDGTLMASGGFDYTILLWKLEAAYPACTAERPESAIPTVRPLTRVDAHKGHIMGLRFKPAAAGDARSYLASCSNDHSLKVWSVRKSGSSYSLSTHWSADDVHESCVSAVCWGKAAGANTLFSSSWDRSVCMFDLNPTIVSGQAEPKVPPLLAHAARVTDMDVTKTGQFLVTVSVDVTAVVWDIAAGCKPLVKYKMSVTNGFPSAVSAGTNVFVSASGFGQIMVWPLPVPAHMDKMAPYRPVGGPSLVPLLDDDASSAKHQVITMGVRPAIKKEGQQAEDRGAGVGVHAGKGAGAGAAPSSADAPQPPGSVETASSVVPRPTA